MDLDGTVLIIIHSIDDGIYKLEDDGQKLVLSNIQEANLGLYKCVGEDDEVIKEFDVDASFKLRGLQKSISVDDGTKAVIECKAKTVSYKRLLKFLVLLHPTDNRLLLMSPSSGSRSPRTLKLTRAMSVQNPSVPRDPCVPLLTIFSPR